MSQAAQLTQLTAPLGHSLGNVNIPPSTFSQQGLGQPLPTIHTGPSLSAAPPSPSTSTPLTAAQQSAKDRAQVLHCLRFVLESLLFRLFCTLVHLRTIEYEVQNAMTAITHDII